MTTESKEIAVLPEKEKAIAVYSTPGGLSPYLERIREQVDQFKSSPPKLDTLTGRKEYRSFAHKLARMKTALDGMKKDCTAEIKQKAAKIDKEGKRSWDLIESWQDEVLEPVIAYEKEQAEIEAKRLADIAAKELQEQVDRDHELAILMYSEHLRQKEEAAKQAVIDAQMAAQKQKEREEQIAKEAADNARIAAEKAAADERQRLANEHARKDLEAQQAIERANREKLEAENERLRQQQAAEQAAAKAKQDAIDAEKKAKDDLQKAVEAEIKKHADAAEAERKAAEQREKSKAHAKKINNEALQDLMAAGLSEECAKQAVTAIAKRAVRNIQINY